jgi:hypothetical protein
LSRRLRAASIPINPSREWWSFGCDFRWWVMKLILCVKTEAARAKRERRRGAARRQQVSTPCTSDDPQSLGCRAASSRARRRASPVVSAADMEASDRYCERCESRADVAVAVTCLLNQ